MAHTFQFRQMNPQWDLIFNKDSLFQQWIIFKPFIKTRWQINEIQTLFESRAKIHKKLQNKISHNRKIRVVFKFLFRPLINEGKGKQRENCNQHRKLVKLLENYDESSLQMFLMNDYLKKYAKIINKIYWYG